MAKKSKAFEEALRIAQTAEKERQKQNKYTYTEVDEYDDSLEADIKRRLNSSAARVNIGNAYNSYRDIVKNLDLYDPSVSRYLRNNQVPGRLEANAKAAATAIPHINNDAYSSQQSKDLWIGMSNEVTDYANQYAQRAAARTGDISALQGLDKDSEAYKQYEGLLRLYGFDTATQAFDSRLNVRQPFQGDNGPLENAMRGGARSYRDVVDMYRGYDADQIENDVTDIAAYVNGFTDYMTPEEYEAARQRVLGATGVDVAEAVRHEDVYSVVDRAIAGRDEGESYLRDYFDQTQQGADVPVSYDEWLGYLDALDRQQEQRDRQAEWAAGIEEKYGHLEHEGGFRQFSQYREEEPGENMAYRALYDLINVAGKDEERAGQFRQLLHRTRDMHPYLSQSIINHAYEYMTDEQRARANYLYDPETMGQFLEYLEDISWDLDRQRQEDELKKHYQWVEDTNPVVTNAAAIGQGLLNSLSGGINIARKAMGEDINEYDYTFQHGLESGMTKAMTAEDIAAATEGVEIFGKNVLTMAYNAGMSAIESVTNAMLYGSAAPWMMGAGSFNSAYQSKLESGLNETDAFIDALVEGGIEVGTEKFSIDALLDTSGGNPLGYFLRNALTETSEELVGYGVNTAYDQIKYGMESKINRRIDELRRMGYGDEAVNTAVKEVLAEVFETGFTAFLSGGASSSVGAVGTARANSKAGANLMDNQSVYQMLQLAETLPLDSRTQRIVQEQMGALREMQHETVEGKDGKPKRVSKDVSLEELEGSIKLSAGKVGRIFREMMKAVDERAQDVLGNAMRRNVQNMLFARGVNDAALTDAVTRIISDNGTATQEDYDAVAPVDAARDVVNQMTAEVELQDNATEIARMASAKGLKTAAEHAAVEKTVDNSESADAETGDVLTDEQISEEVALQEVQEAAKEYGEGNAETMVNAYQPGQDPVAYTEQFKRAYQYGEEGRSLDIVSKSKSFSGLTEQQVKMAYEMGRGKRVFDAEQAVKNRKGLVSVGNVDISALKGIRLNDVQRNGVMAISQLAKDVGFNVEYFASEAGEDGKFKRENGSYNKSTRTLSLDINAGRLSNTDTNYAIMQTAGHELTHFMKQFADADLWNSYQEFVFGHLSEKMDEAALDAKVQEQIDRAAANKVTLDRAGAIEEIVAEASGDALQQLMEDDIQAMAETNPSLLQKIGEFIGKWVKQVRTLIQQAYKGQTARNAIAEQMVDAVEDVGRQWATLLRNASTNARIADNQEIAGMIARWESQFADDYVNEDGGSGRIRLIQLPDYNDEQAEEDFDETPVLQRRETVLPEPRPRYTRERGVRDRSTGLLTRAAESRAEGIEKPTSRAEARARLEESRSKLRDLTGDLSGDNLSADELYARYERRLAREERLKADKAARYEDDYSDELFDDNYDDDVDGEVSYRSMVLPDVIPRRDRSFFRRRGRLRLESLAEAMERGEDVAVDAQDEVKYSLRTVDGKDVVWVDDNIITQKPKDQNYADFMVDYLTEHVGEMSKIIESGQGVYLGKDLPKEYAWSKYSQRIRSRNQQIYKAKARMASGIGEAINIATNRRWEKTKHPENKDAKYGVYKYDAKIAFPETDSSGEMSAVQAYDVTLVIRNASDGRKYLYDIQNIKKDTVTANTLYFKSRGGAIKAAQREGISSGKSIAQEGGDVKFSLRDNQTDTPEFKNWFKDSKIVNSDGTPKIMYHGSPNDFTVFDIKKARSSGLYGRGFYFTDSESHGGTYGKLYEVYLSIQHPLTPGGDSVTRTQVRKFLEAVAENEDDYSIENYGTYDVNEILRSVYRKDAFAVIQDVNATAIGDMVEAVKLFNEVNGTEYDGIVVDTETVAFEPTQIKSATSNVGTFDPENPDMRYQLRDPDQISDRELLANVMESAATNETELDYVRRYRKKIGELDQKQRELNEKKLAIDEAKNAGRRADAASLQSAADIIARQIDRMDGKLLQFEAAKPLQDVVKRQRESMKRKADQRVADRVEAVRKREAERREKLQQTLTEVREKRDQKIAELKKEKQDKTKEIRDKKNARIAELKKEKATAVKEVREERDEFHDRHKYLDQVRKAVHDLREMVTTPTTKKHVPQFLRKPLGEFLDTLDFTSMRKLEGGKETVADRDFADAADALRKAIEKIRTEQSGLNTTAGEFFNGYMDLSSDFMDTFDDLVTKIRAAITAAGKIGETPINQLKSADLHDLGVCLRAIHTSVNKMNKMLATARYMYADEASRDTITDLDKFKKNGEHNKLMQKVVDFFDWKNATPYFAFKRFGRGGSAIFESLQNGWDKLANLAGDLIEFTKKAYKPEEVKQWESDIRTVKLSSGAKVQMPVSHLMSLYCAAKREQALGHLMGGGIRIEEFDAKRGKSIAQGENYILTEADLETFRKQLNARQLHVADVLQRDMAERGGKLGNEISMQRFGYEMFGEENYFPIESDRNNMMAKDEKAHENSLLRLLNMSATKDLTKGANNAIVIRSIFDVYTDHMSDMIKYNALALPILDAMKWLNYVERTEGEDGKITTRSVQKSLELTYGEEAKRYLMEFIRNLNGETEGGREDGLINKLTSNYKIAAVGANLRVGVLQITSLPRAALAIKWKYLRRGIAKWNTRKGMSKNARENVGIAKWKSLGFYDTNISRNMRELVKHDEKATDKVRGWSMKLAEWGDAWTMGVLYGAVESELLNETRLRTGSDEFKQKLNERMRDIIYRTQVVDSTMTRSHLMRQKGAISSVLSFMSEPTLTLNMVNDVLFDLRMNHRGGKDAKWNPAASKKLAKTMAVYVFTVAAASVVEALFTAYRDDDEYETFVEKYLEALMGDYSDAESFGDYWGAFWGGSVGSNLNPIGNVPIISDLIDAWKNGAAKQMWQEFLGDISGGTTSLIKAIQQDGTTAEYYNACYKILNGFSRLSGIPLSGAVREAVALYNTFFAEPMGWKRVQTREDSAGATADAMLKALTAGDKETSDYVRERAALYGIEEKDLNDALSERVRAAYTEGSIDRATADRLLTGEAGKRDRDAENALVKGDYQIDTGLKHSDMKDDFIDGTITEKQAREYLKKYNGMRDDEIGDKINEWKYEKETGLVYGDMKADFIDGELTETQVKNYRMKFGGASADDVKETLGEWKYERDTGLAYSEMKLDYAEGVISETQVRNYLAKYGLKNEEEVEESISNFDYYEATGRTGSAPKYWRIAHAYDTGGDYQAYIDEAFNTIMYGGEKQKSWKQARNQIASSVASFYKKGYLAVKGTPAGDRMLEHILDLYEAIGYPRSQQREYIEENWIEEE